jgi:transcriptional regulator with XRE-family HTH domain
MRQRRHEGPHPVDIHVGLRLKQRRTALKISQQEFATSQGITFQQVQKYERGLNRISASRLYHLSEALSVPVTFFFEGISGTSTTAPPMSGEFTDPLDTPDAAELSGAYRRITDPLMRRRLLDLAQSLGPKQPIAHARRSDGRIRSRSAGSHRARDR